MLSPKLKFWSRVKRHKVSAFSLQPSALACSAFTLIEVMVVMVLLSLIVLALMAVFNSTQAAFRASVTQADVLESGRASMDLMADDLRAMSPSHGQSFNAANFCVYVLSQDSPPSPLIQPMVGGSSQRTNVLESFYILSRGNQNGVPTWYGVGYAVAATNASGGLYPLYRFATNYPVASADPVFMFTNDFTVFLGHVSGGSHLMDGVVALTVRAYDINGGLMNSNIITVASGQVATNRNVHYIYYPPKFGQVGFVMWSNTLPASVEIEMGVLEDRALQRAESLPNPASRSNYLAGAAGQVHVFRQRVSIPNVDPAAYQ
jgi:prepilin-type N-terminal cleavage/methylation domain-containing protein